MAFEEITSLDADQTVAIGGKNKKTGKPNPTSVEGYYLGTREVRSPKSKSGSASIHFFQTPKGKIGVWGKTDMDRKMMQVKPGLMTKIVFDKMTPTPNGDMYTYKVAQDKANGIDVAELANNNDHHASSDSADDGSRYDDNDNYQEDPEEEAAPSRQPSRASTAAVQALLNRKKA